MNALLKALSSELDSRKEETHFTFGSVNMSYDDMYQSLYIKGEPKNLFDVVESNAQYEFDMLDVEERSGMYQFLYFKELNEICEELEIDYDDVIENESKYKDFQLVYLVNYKGEGEGLFIYDQVKDGIAGRFNGKYDYS